MSDLFIISFLILVVMNILLWIKFCIYINLILSKSKSEEDVVRIIGEALKTGAKEYHNAIDYYPSGKVIYLLGYVNTKDFDRRLQDLHSRLGALCRHLGVRIELQSIQMEKHIVVKRDKKAK